MFILIALLCRYLLELFGSLIWLCSHQVLALDGGHFMTWKNDIYLSLKGRKRYGAGTYTSDLCGIFWEKYLSGRDQICCEAWSTFCIVTDTLSKHQKHGQQMATSGLLHTCDHSPFGACNGHLTPMHPCWKLLESPWWSEAPPMAFTVAFLHLQMPSEAIPCHS